MSALVMRDCNWCGAHVPHAAGRGGGPVAHVRATHAHRAQPVIMPCPRRRSTTAEEREHNLAEMGDL